MEAFALYLLKSVIWLSGFALVFLLFLKNERFFFLNRIYLIAGILTSFLFPFISVHYTVVVPDVGNIQAASVITNSVQNTGISNSPNIGLILMVLYSSGVLFVMALVVRQIRSILKTIKKAEVISHHQVKLIRTNDYISAFSFFSYVFVNPSITDPETKEIVNHELVHISQKHWFDLVLVELLCMLQWFNPFAWIYIRFIRQNHEYLADEVALQRTSDSAVYRATLLNQIVGSPVVSLANSFNYSLNKKRFNMMKNIISSPYRKMKILFILPVFAIVFYSFAKPEYSYTNVTDNSGKTDPIITLQTKEVKGTVVQQNGKPLQGAIVMVKGTTLGSSADLNGYFKLEKVPDDSMLIVTHIGFKSVVVKPVFTSDMTIKMMRDTVNLKSIGIPPPPPPPPTYDKDGNFVSNSLSETNLYSMKVKSENGIPPLFVIDGKTSGQDLSKLDPNTIESITVLKNESAIALYGDKGINGVLLITTKKVGSQNKEEKVQYVEVKKSQPTDNDIYVTVEEMPTFPGGNKAMESWVYGHVKAMGNVVKEKISEPVIVIFTVSSNGKVSNAKVKKPVHPLLDAEAIRVVNSMPDWKPGVQGGTPVDVYMQLPIDFKLK